MRTMVGKGREETATAVTKEEMEEGKGEVRGGDMFVIFNSQE